jgi:hypothetical protein
MGLKFVRSDGKVCDASRADIELWRSTLADARKFINDWGPDETSMLREKTNFMLAQIDSALAQGHGYPLNIT